MNDIEWLDKWYAQIEHDIPKYKRPANWKDKLVNAQNTTRNTVKNQHEGKKGAHYYEDY